MTDLEERYRQTSERLRDVQRRMADFEAEERVRAEQRKRIETKLELLGVDVARIDEERVRVEKEYADHLQEVEDQCAVLEEFLLTYGSEQEIDYHPFTSTVDKPELCQMCGEREEHQIHGGPTPEQVTTEEPTIPAENGVVDLD